MGIFTVWLGIFPSIGILMFVLYWRRIVKTHRHIPGPPQTLLRGNFKELRKLSATRGLSFQLILKQWQDIYGDLFVFRLFHMSMVVVADPKEIQKLLTDATKFPKSKRYEEFHALYGTRLIPQSILVEQNQTAWAMKRRLLNVFFKRNAIDEYLVCFDEAAGRLMSRIQTQMDEATDGEPISLYPLLTEAALDSVLRALFNIKLDRYKGFAEKVGKLFPALQAQLRSPFRRIFPGKNEKRMAQMLEEIRQTCRDIINDNLLNNGQGGICSNVNMCAQSQSENRHYDDMVDEVLVMVMAGTDSTANTLGFLVKEMCNYAPYQDRMAGEILRAMDGDDKVATRNFLSKLVFTQQMINETLRKYPTICGTTRTCKEDTVISGIKIPANTVIMISTYLLHHNKKYWKNPSLFDPERFAASEKTVETEPETSNKSEGKVNDATEQEVNAKKNCFLPFSKGQRVCIGANFAKMEMQIVMARLLSQFHVECLSTSDDFNEALALRPGDSVPVRLTKLVKH